MCCLSFGRADVHNTNTVLLHLAWLLVLGTLVDLAVQASRSVPEIVVNGTQASRSVPEIVINGTDASRAVFNCVKRDQGYLI